MTYDDNDHEASGWRSANADLTHLVTEGISSDVLESCQGLEYSIRWELGLREPLEPGVRIRLLDKILSTVIEEQRREAFDRRNEGTFRTAAGWPANQVAATGELLGLTDDRQWQQVRDLRCRELGETWDALRARAGPDAERRLRAMLWIGFSSARTIERAEPGLVHALESAVRKYARTNRAALVALVAGEPPRSPTTPEASRTRVASPQPLARGLREREKRHGLVWTTIAATALGVTIVVSAFSLTNDEPSLAVGPKSSLSSPAITRPAPSFTPSPTPTQPTRTESPGIVRLEQLPRCHRLPVGSPLAKRLRAKDAAVVDVRCRANPSVRVAARSGPGRRYRELAHLRTGQIIDDVCLRSRGQRTSNAAKASSRVWVGYRPANSKRYAFTSALWVQGENGAPRCTASRRNDSS